MSQFVDRRRFLSRSLQVTAAGGLVSTISSTHTRSSAAGSDPVRVRWDTQRRRWSQRPADPGSLILFISTDDPTAPQPRDFDLASGDVWWRHPCSDDSAGQWRL
jgi:hypothetical protein